MTRKRVTRASKLPPPEYPDGSATAAAEADLAKLTAKEQAVAPRRGQEAFDVLSVGAPEYGAGLYVGVGGLVLNELADTVTFEDAGWSTATVPVQAHARGTAPRADGLEFEVEISSDGRLLELRLRHPDPSNGSISARALRTIPVGEIVRVVRTAITQQAQLTSDIAEIIGDPESKATAATRRVGREFAQRPRTGAAGRDDIYYAEVAQLYVGLLSTRSPNKELASRLGASATRVRNLIYEARERGLLTSPGRGRAGGELTPKALELLRSQHG